MINRSCSITLLLIGAMAGCGKQNLTSSRVLDPIPRGQNKVYILPDIPKIETSNVSQSATTNIEINALKAGFAKFPLALSDEATKAIRIVKFEEDADHVLELVQVKLTQPGNLELEYSMENIGFTYNLSSSQDLKLNDVVTSSYKEFAKPKRTTMENMCWLTYRFHLKHRNPNTIRQVRTKSASYDFLRYEAEFKVSRLDENTPGRHGRYTYPPHQNTFSFGGDLSFVAATVKNLECFDEAYEAQIVRESFASIVNEVLASIEVENE